MTGSRLSRFLRMDGRRRALLIEAMTFLGIAWLSLRIFSFRRVAGHLGVLMPRHFDVRRSRPAGADDEMAGEIGRAVRRMAAHAPFQALCFQQAIAAKMMLRRRGIESALHFGVDRERAAGTDFEAHAWLEAAGTPVTGYPVADRFVEIACLV